MKTTRVYVIGMLILQGILLSLSCSKDTAGPADSTVEDFATGKETVYTVSGSGTVSVRDSVVSGATFVVTPEPGATLTVAPITAGPDIPFEGTQFHVEYTGEGVITLRVPAESENEDVALLSYGALEGAAIDDMSGNTTWWGVPPSGEGDGYVEFSVDLAAQAAGKIAAGVAPNTNNFAISKIASGTQNFAAMRAMYETVGQVIDQWIGNLPADQQAIARQKVQNLPYTVMWSGGGNSYKHVTSIFSPKVILFFNKDAKLISIAHETGHYICHALMGDARYNELYNRFPTDFWGSAVEHDLGSYRAGRIEILEDYPYIAMLMATGDVDQYDISNVSRINNLRDMNDNADPASKDYPSHEGFGAAMLASLLRTSDTVYTFSKVKGWDTAKAPVVGASWGDVLAILGRGPRDVNELRGYIQDYLDAQGNTHRFKLPAMMEPLGWSYNGSGTVVDKSNNPIKGAHVQSITQDGTKEYRTILSTATGSDGKFLLPRIYPGTNILRIFWNSDKDSTDVSFTADWSAPTSTTLALGTLSVDTAPAPTTLTLTRTGITESISYGDDPMAEITMTATLTVTGAGIEIDDRVDYGIKAPLNTPITARVTVSFNKNVIKDHSVYGGIYTVGDPKFEPRWGGSISYPYGAAEITNTSTDNVLSCTLTFVNNQNGIYIGPYGSVPCQVSGYEDEELVIWSSWSERLTGPSFRLIAK